MSLTPAAIEEKNKIHTDSAWLTLFEVQAPTPIYIVDDNQNATWNGIEWLASPMKVGEITNNGSENPSLTVQFSNVRLNLGVAVAQLKGAGGTPVIVRIVNSKLLSEPASREEYFEIVKTNIDPFWVTFTLGIRNDLKKKIPAFTIFKNFCNYEEYKGLECGSTSELLTCNRTLQDCRLRNNSGRFGGYINV
jgi:phage-related protein